MKSTNNLINIFAHPYAYLQTASTFTAYVPDMFADATNIVKAIECDEVIPCVQPLVGLRMSNSQRLRGLILTIVNSEASKTSQAAAARSDQDLHARTSQEMARLIEKGQASKVEIITSLAGAEVYIDGNKAGATPLEFVLIKRDNPRALTIKLPGYKTVEKTLVPDGNNIPITIVLESQRFDKLGSYNTCSPADLQRKLPCNIVSL